MFDTADLGAKISAYTNWQREEF